MNVLITGIEGFVGAKLAEYIISEKKAEVFGSAMPGAGLEALEGIQDKITLLECDITKRDQIDSAVKKSGPDFVFHFAAQSNVTQSWKIPNKTMEVNISGTMNLLDAVREHASGAKVMLASSREVYGKVEMEPISEGHALNPANPYGASKLAMEFLAMQYRESHGIFPVIIRSFNLTGPGRPADFVCSDWAKQLAEIELGKRKPEIETGNINTVRDFTDVRDAVRAYWLSVEKCKPAEPYNVCSGIGREMKDVLDMILSLSEKEVRVVKKEKKIVKIDIPYAVGKNEKIGKATGWKPEIEFKQTLADLVEYWKAKA